MKEEKKQYAKLADKEKEDKNISKEDIGLNNERRPFLECIFNHLNNLHLDCEETVILISFKADLGAVFSRIKGQKRSESDENFPAFLQIQNLNLVDSSKMFLKPEESLNFITLHYLLKNIRRSKFVFVFSDDDSKQRPIRNIKTTFERFIDLFKDKVDVGLFDSCTILIPDSNEKMTDEDYYTRIVQGIIEPGYVLHQRANEIVALAERIRKNKALVLWKEEGNRLQQIKKLKKSLQNQPFFEVNNGKETSIQITLRTNYQKFVHLKIAEVWLKVFQYLYENLFNLISETSERQKYLYKAIPDYLVFTQNILKKEKSFGLNEVRNMQTLHIIQFANKWIRLIYSQNMDLPQIQNHKICLCQLLDSLYEFKFLTDPRIKAFMLSYFTVYEFLYDDVREADSKSIVERIMFAELIGNIDILNEHLRKIIFFFISQLERDLIKANSAYPYKPVIKEIQEFVKICKEAEKHESLYFYTDRVHSKLQKSIFNLKNTQIKNHKTDSLEKVTMIVELLKENNKLKMASSEQLSDLCVMLGDELLKLKAIDLALKMYEYCIEYKITNKIMMLFEKDMKIDVKVMRFLKPDDWGQLINVFQYFAKFLLKIGKNQKIREICIEGLNIAKVDVEIDLFKRILVKARGQEARDEHNNFLQSSILQQKQIEEVDEVELEKIESLIKRMKSKIV